MSRRRHARLHLPPLSGRDALALVHVLERAIAAIERAHGDEMRRLREMQRIEARARRHDVTTYDLDADPDLGRHPKPGRSHVIDATSRPNVAAAMSIAEVTGCDAGEIMRIG